MITQTSLTHTSVRAKLRAAIAEAEEKALTAPTGVVVVDVYNSEGTHTMSVCGIRNRPYRVCDAAGIDITDLVKNALSE
jgi:hypothetical protein